MRAIQLHLEYHILRFFFGFIPDCGIDGIPGLVNELSQQLLHF
jgi:hypothetical protein